MLEFLKSSKAFLNKGTKDNKNYMLSKFESVKIYWLSVKFDWFDSEKYFCTDESVKMRITGSISENLTDSDLESGRSKLKK